MSKLFEKLKEGLEDIIAYQEDKIPLRSEEIELPKKEDVVLR